jgi:hypothetical protein
MAKENSSQVVPADGVDTARATKVEEVSTQEVVDLP